MDLNSILKDKRTSMALLGVTKTEFHELLEFFQQSWDKRYPRRNLKKGGHPFAIKSTESKLFFILYYLKTYPTFDELAATFGIHRSNACRNTHLFMSILIDALKVSGALPKTKIRSKKEFFKNFPDIRSIVIDGTERRKRRPKNPEKQREFYSGKKKTHTMKNLCITNTKKGIIMASETVPGKTHDKTFFFEHEAGIPTSR